MKTIVYNVIGDFLKNNSFVQIFEEKRIIEFSNNKCILKFIEDNYDIYLEVINPDNPSISFNFGIILYVTKGIKLEFYSDIFDTDLRYEKQCRHYLTYLNELINIVQGDFSWQSQYKIFDLQQNELLTKLSRLRAKNPNHPIVDKYNNGDQTWKDDIARITI